MEDQNRSKKRLSLNKETLLRLQEQQLKAIIGAEAMMSNGTSSVCPEHSVVACCGVSVNGSCSDKAAAADAGATCCKKSC